MTALDGGPHGTTETAAAYVEAGLHKTPGSIHRALGKYLTGEAPEMIGVYISHDIEYPASGGPGFQFYLASIHVYEPEWGAWLEHAGFTSGDVVTTDRGEMHNTLSVCRGDGITIFTIVAKPDPAELDAAIARHPAGKGGERA